MEKKAMKQETFGFLKDRHIFTPGGAKDLHEYLTAREESEIHKNDVRFGRKQKGNNKRNTRRNK